MDTKALRQKILDLAIRGKLVPQDPNDEPASVLLERIREQKKQMVKDGKLKPKDIKKDTVIFKGDDNLHYERFNDGTVKCIEDEIPFELPEGWEWCNLGLITDVFGRIGFRGYTKNDLVAKGKGAITLSPSNIIDNKMDYSSCTYISWAKYEESPEIMIHNNDILLVKTGSSYGKSAFVEDLPEKATINPQFVVLKETRINPQFLCYFLQSNYAKVNFDKLVVGTAIPTFSQANLNAMYIAFPGINEQKRIVNKILELLKYIDTINDEKKCLQSVILQTKSKILDLAIHGKLVSQDPNDEPAIELLKRINPGFTPCDNGHYTNLPKGWAICKLSDLCRIENGFAFSSNDYKSQGIPLVRISNITHNTIDITDCVYVEGITDNKFKISKGDLLIAMSGATTGKMGVYLFDEIAYLNQRVGNIKILNKSSLFPDYRNIYMQSKVDEILKIAYGGAQPNISASVIGNFDFPLPPYKEQIRIVETVQRIFDQLDTITESL